MVMYLMTRSDDLSVTDEVEQFKFLHEKKWEYVELEFD